MAWRGPWGREHIHYAPDWDEIRSRAFFYPEVIVVPELHSAYAPDDDVMNMTPEMYERLAEAMEEAENRKENDEKRENEERVLLKELHKELHKGDPLKLLAALEVLRPKMLIMNRTYTQGPAFWHRLSRVTSLKGLMVSSLSTGFDDRALQEVTRLPHLSALNLTRTEITDAGLACLETCPQLKTLSLQGSRVTREGALACLRRCPNLQIKLNGDGVSRR